VSNVLEATEPLEILVNNAGNNRPKLMLEVSVEDFDAIMTLNVRSAFFVAQAVVKRLLRPR
jgi:NAD(P)-dependent dehydrogenase (short-subunit alcohol dehydrogenase family)